MRNQKKNEISDFLSYGNFCVLITHIFDEFFPIAQKIKIA